MMSGLVNLVLAAAVAGLSVFVLYRFAMLVLSLPDLRRRNRAGADVALHPPTPFFGIIIPAHDEEMLVELESATSSAFVQLVEESER